MLCDLRIDRVPVRQDDRGRWWYSLEGSLDKILGITGRDFAVTDTPFVQWSDEDFGETDDPADGPAEPYQEGSCPREGPRALG